MKILVIDAQGGGLGRELVHSIREKYKDIDITCVGTNSHATSAMLKAGATRAATGENALIVNSQMADIIIGPIGILLTNSMCGEITASMAEAVSTSRAKRIFAVCAAVISFTATIRRARRMLLFPRLSPFRGGAISCAVVRQSRYR